MFNRIGKKDFQNTHYLCERYLTPIIDGSYADVYGIHLYPNSIGIPDKEKTRKYFPDVWFVNDGWQTKDRAVRKEVIRRYKMLKWAANTAKNEAHRKESIRLEEKEQELQKYFREGLDLNDDTN